MQIFVARLSIFAAQKNTFTPVKVGYFSRNLSTHGIR